MLAAGVRYANNFAPITVDCNSVVDAGAAFDSNYSINFYISTSYSSTNRYKIPGLLIVTTF